MTDQIQLCSRCDSPTESPAEGLACLGGRVHHTFLCCECMDLQENDPERFFQDGWSSLRQEVQKLPIPSGIQMSLHFTWQHWCVGLWWQWGDDENMRRTELFLCPLPCVLICLTWHREIKE